LNDLKQQVLVLKNEAVKVPRLELTIKQQQNKFNMLLAALSQSQEEVLRAHHKTAKK
jgi:hypothetical protein